MTNPQPYVRRVGDSALLVSFPDHDPDEASRHIRGVLSLFDEAQSQGVVDLLPARSSVLVLYDPLIGSPETFQALLRVTAGDAEESPSQLVEIPVVYGGDAGPDLPFLAERFGLTEAEVVELHASTEYTVYFIGFLPGFPYLGPLPRELRVPRLDTPRALVPAGSVAVAEDLSGIYPVASPGGWRIIGRTPYRLFDPLASPPSLLQPGDRVRFIPVDEAVFARLHLEALAAPSKRWRD